MYCFCSLQPSDTSCYVAREAPAEKHCTASEILPWAGALLREMWVTRSQQDLAAELAPCPPRPKSQHLALGHGSISLDGAGLLGGENNCLRKGEAFFPSGVK